METVDTLNYNIKLTVEYHEELVIGGPGWYIREETWADGQELWPAVLLYGPIPADQIEQSRTALAAAFKSRLYNVVKYMKEFH